MAHVSIYPWKIHKYVLGVVFRRLDFGLQYLLVFYLLQRGKYTRTHIQGWQIFAEENSYFESKIRSISTQ